MIYIWHKEQVIEAEWIFKNLRHRYNYHFVYDPADPDHWGQLNHGVWSPKEPEQVPAEFRASLLIMGIS